MNDIDTILTKAIFATIMVAIISMSSCSMYTRHKVTEAIKAGADPLAAACAIEADKQSSPTCVILATKK